MAETGDQERTPTRVQMYSIAAGAPGQHTVIGEFRWSAAEGVTLTELNDTWGRAARRIYETGANSATQRRYVSRDDGPAFMKTLLEPSTSTYYGFIDKTDES